jgi:hypothetical protein
VSVKNVSHTNRPRESNGTSIKVDAEAFRAVKVERDVAPATFTEWVINLEFDPFMPSRSTKREETLHFKRTREGGKPFDLVLVPA